MYGEIEKSPTMAVCEAERPTVMVELQNRRDRTAKQLQDIDAAIELFKQQPALERALTSIGRLGIRL